MSISFPGNEENILALSHGATSLHQTEAPQSSHMHRHDDINLSTSRRPDWSKLPDDWWQLESLPSHDLSSLRLTCKRMAALLAFQTTHCTVQRWDQAVKALTTFPQLKSIAMSSADTPLHNGARFPSNSIMHAKFRSAHTALQAIRYFPSLESIDLSECLDVTAEHLHFLGNFKNLKEINLSNCSQLSGRDIEFLPSIKNLTKINLSNCKNITNIHEDALNALKNLTHLTLSGCSRVPDAEIKKIKQLQNLEYLDLSNCIILSDAGIDWGNLKRLQHLDLGNCPRLTDQAMSVIGTLHNLQYLNLGLCDSLTDESLKNLGFLHGLKHLNLSSSYSTNDRLRTITEQSFSKIIGLRQLEKLILRETWLDKPSMSRIHQLENLQYLDFQARDRNLSQDFFLQLCNLKKLQHLDLEGCTVSDHDDFLHLRNLTNLKYLSLEDCVKNAGKDHDVPNTDNNIVSIEDGDEEELEDTIDDDDTQMVAALHNLEALHFSASFALTDQGIENLGRLSKLKELTLTQIEHLKNPNFAKLKNLKKLNLRDSDTLEDQTFASLPNLKNLEALSFSLNSTLTDKAFEHIGQVTSLKHLKIYRPFGHFETMPNLLTDRNIGSISQLRNLDHLEIAGSEDLSPACFSHLAKLEKLRFLKIANCGKLVDSPHILYLAHLSQLESLSLFKLSPRSQHDLSFLMHLKNLRHLAFTGSSGITNDSILNFGFLPGLKSLNIKNSLAISNLWALTCLRHLQDLNLQNCHNINNASLESLANMKWLKKLNISGYNQITPSAIRAFRQAVPTCEIHGED